MDRYVIVVARDRPDLFRQLHQVHGHEMRVLFDRRRVPRTLAPGERRPAPDVYSQIERDGFLVALTAAGETHRGCRYSGSPAANPS